METDRERRDLTAVYAPGPGPNPAHANVARSTNGQLRIEFFGDQMPPYMEVMICDEKTHRAVELDPDAHAFWRLEDEIGPPPWLSMPSSRMEDTSETKFLSGVRCRLYRAAGSGEIWVAEDLGITMRQSEVFEGIDQITLQVSSLTVGEPDPKLFLIPASGATRMGGIVLSARA